jgi:hypothetical protein
MVETTSPLAQAERTLLINRCLYGEWNMESFPTLDPRQLVLVLYSTGIHPAVLEDTGLYGLRVEREPRGLILKLRRPKTRRPVTIPLFWQRLFEEHNPNADSRMQPFWPDIQSWIEDWLKFWTERSRQVIFQDVRRWGMQNGLPRLCPRVLRHDFIARCYETTRDVNLTAALATCSPRIAMDYARLGSVMEWFAAPPSTR